MGNLPIESGYPVTFRLQDTRALADHLKHRHSVELVGMNRVGISNFLNFFLYHPAISTTYISPKNNNVFIIVDMNDLVEVEILPFWTLLLKRVIDILDSLEKVSSSIKEAQQKVFLRAIQTKDMFYIIESIRESLQIIIKHDYIPTIFFVRFDRFSAAATPEFLSNLRGIRSNLFEKLAYVFTSHRPLAEVLHDMPAKNTLLRISKPIYIKPASGADSKIIFGALLDKYGVTITDETERKLLTFAGGHVQYIQLTAILLSSLKGADSQTAKDIFSNIVKDERINLLSEEIWSSLSHHEQKLLKELVANGKSQFSAEHQYFDKTGIIEQRDGRLFVFNLYFEEFVKSKVKKSLQESTVDMTKKEHNLFRYLESNLGVLCDRESIIQEVWPEYTDLSVSDWTIDRLVSRLRGKLRLRSSPYSIITIKTRGFKMEKHH